MNRITYLFICVLFGCSKPVTNLRQELTDDEAYWVINNLYTDYLDSLNRPYRIYHRMAVLEDSSVIKKQIENLEGSHHFIYEFSEPFNPVQMPVFDQLTWKSSHLPGFTLVEKEELDAEVEKRISSYGWYKDDDRYFAITRPYRPSSSMRIVIQEYELFGSQGCFPTRNRSTILFAKGNNGWQLEHFYRD